MTGPRNGELLDDRYRVERPIARGGMSTVYRCVDLRLGRAVAAKVMHDHLAQDPVFVQRFKREARAMAQLSHPNLVAIHDFSASGDPIFLVMELITGGTLRELLAERGPMPPHAATAVLRSVLTGLSAVHSRGLVHRDIKPDNVLINADHRVKLGDFGLVRAASRQATTDQIVGTVSYLSPEQVTGEDITPAADVYSTGVVLYELLTGEVPFTGDTPLDHAVARLTSDVPAPSSRILGVPPLFDALVASATAREPEARFADAAEFLAALDDVAAELELPAFTVPVPRNSAAARTAAQPTDFSGVRSDGVGGHSDEDDVFEPTRTIPTGATDAAGAADAADATEVIDPTPEDPTTVMAPKAASEETLAEWNQAGQSARPREQLSFETRLDLPTQPRAEAAGPVPAPAPAPEYRGYGAAFPDPGYPGPQTEAAGHAQGGAVVPAAGAQEPMPVPSTAEEEPMPRLLSNRSPIGFSLWLLAVIVITIAVGVGAWWFGSGNYQGLPTLWQA